MHGTTTQNERNAMSAALDEMLIDSTEELWNRNAALEMAMCDVGADQFRAAAKRSQDRGQLSHLKPFRQLTETLMVPVERALSGWLQEWSEAGRGRRPVALQYLKNFPTDVATLITVREVLDRLGHREDGQNQLKVMSVANSIGMRIQLEARMLAWQKVNPKLWKEVQSFLDRQHATGIHRQRVNTFRFNEQVRDTIAWEDWPREHVFHLGFALIEQLVVGTGGRFRVVPDEAAERNRAKHVNPYIIVPDAEMTEALFAALEHEEVRHPVFMPTIIKPAPWSTMRDGGYHTEMLRGQRELIRFNASQEEQKRKASRELSHVQMGAVYDAINTVQEVGWRVNHRVYEVARHCWERDLAIAGLPRKTKVDISAVAPRPEAANTDEAVDRAWRRRTKNMHAANAKLPAFALRSQRTLDIAARFVDEVFYFPHFLDFRGRMYPIPDPSFSPQGQDICRGLLTFAEGKPVDAQAAYWLAIQLANTWGMDKLPLDERYEWVLAQQDMWLSIDADPMADKRWADSPGKDYWQVLAAVFEWVRYLNEGEGMVSALPIRVDGTCNGIQHLSAMVRDEEGGTSVNLIPDAIPHDIYREIGSLVEDMCQMYIEEGGDGAVMAARWLEACGGALPRSLTKRPVMIFPYGGTKEAYRKYTAEWMHDFDPMGEKIPPEMFSDMLRFMVNAIWAAVNVQLKKPKQVQMWLKTCAELACAAGTPLRWETPCGFVVRHFYGERKMRQIETTIDGQLLKLVDWKVTATLDTSEHLKGIPPNFTHSMDASVLITTIVKAWNAGVDSITCIHDAYGTVAADMGKLNAALRESFVWTYQQPVLSMFRDQCIEVLDDDFIHREAMPPLPEFGTLDIEQVLDSDYFFA